MLESDTLPSDERTRLRESLLRYCADDTLGLARVIEVLETLAGLRGASGASRMDVPPQLNSVEGSGGTHPVPSPLIPQAITPGATPRQARALQLSTQAAAAAQKNLREFRMRIPRYWARADYMGCSRCSWSNVSAQEAQYLAEQRAFVDAHSPRPSARPNDSDYWNWPYGDGSLIREPILADLLDDTGQLVRVVTRNSYGARILNGLCDVRGRRPTRQCV